MLVMLLQIRVIKDGWFNCLYRLDRWVYRSRVGVVIRPQDGQVNLGQLVFEPKGVHWAIGFGS
jgi:hypothetical protein